MTPEERFHQWVCNSGLFLPNFDPNSSIGSYIHDAFVAGAASSNDTLRRALVGLVGVDTPEELEQMEAVLRAAPVPAGDKIATIDAIRALLEVR